MSGEVSDHHGKPLREGVRVEAWRDGVRFTARMKEVRPRDPGSGYHRVILVRDGDQVDVRSFSDAVAVISEGN